MNHPNVGTKKKIDDKNDLNIVNVLTDINGIPDSGIDSDVIYSQKSKYKALFLCCLGLIGIAGLHKFYTGRKLSGVVYFFTLGYLFIGTIMDLMSIVVGDYRDANGLFLKE